MSLIKVTTLTTLHTEDLREFVLRADVRLDPNSGQSVAHITTTKLLNDEEIERVEYEIEGQYSDGWGENDFEIVFAFDKLTTFKQ